MRLSHGGEQRTQRRKLFQRPVQMYDVEVFDAVHSGLS